MKSVAAMEAVAVIKAEIECRDGGKCDDDNGETCHVIEGLLTSTRRCIYK